MRIIRCTMLWAYLIGMLGLVFIMLPAWIAGGISLPAFMLLCMMGAVSTFVITLMEYGKFETMRYLGLRWFIRIIRG